MSATRRPGRRTQGMERVGTGMDGAINRRLNAGDGARRFNDAHPSDEPAWTAMAGQLEERLRRAEDVARSRVVFDGESRAGTASARKLRRQVARGLLRVLIRAGQAAARSEPALGPRFRPIPPGLSSRGFLAAAQGVVEAAREQLATLAPLGATQEVIDQTAALLEQFRAASERAAVARNARVQARAQLQVLAAEVMDLVLRLDAFYKHRFVDQPDTLQAWTSARNVVGPFRGAKIPGLPEEEITPSGEVPPAGNDVSAAA